ncbi:MAG: response regulator [Patescibacteria group bacterium]
MNNKKLKILLVDDDEFIKILFRDIFWIHDFKKIYEVSTIDNLSKAKEIIKNKELCPDVIFLDLNLNGPKMGNFSLEENKSLNFLKDLKNDIKTKDITIIIFSGYDDKNLIKKAKESGADEYLVKGEFLPQDLIKITENILSKTKKS